MNATNKKSVIPWAVTLGLGIFAFLLSIAGYVMRLLAGDTLRDVLMHALKVVPVFVVLVPMLMCAGACLMNRFGDVQIHMRNAWTLGWLLSVVAMLSIMGVYS